MKALKYIMLAPVLFILMTGCKDAFFVPEPNNDPVSLFEYFWNDYNDHYAVFDERNVDWKSIYDEYRPQVDAQTTEDELYEIFKAMLLPLNDSHIKLTRPGEKTYNPNYYSGFKNEDSLFSLDVIETYFTSETKRNGYDFNTFSWIGDVGYVHFKWTTDNFVVLDEILDEFENAKGLIVDFRHNGGGSFTWALDNFGRMTDQTRLIAKVKTKIGPGNQFGDWYEWKITPEGKHFDKPIIFITDRFTISAGERLTQAFKTLPNVTHIGDTTNGAISTFVGRELANDWSYSMVTQKVYSADGNIYEGIGIPPDIFFKNTQSEVDAGIDRTLEFAIDQLK